MTSIKNAISIKTKLIRMQLLLAITILLVSASFVFMRDFFLFKESIERSIEATAQILSQNLIPALAFADPEQANKVLASVQAESKIQSVYVIDRNGNLFAQYGALSDEDPKSTQKIAGNMTVGNSSYFYFPLKDDDESYGTIYLNADISAFISQYIIFIWIGVGVFAMALIISYILAHLNHRALSEPIMSLALTAKHVSESGDYSLRMIIQPQNVPIEEIATLSQEFNDMLDQIQIKEEKISVEKEIAENASKAKSQFLANISHELRTPMHGILSFARFGQQRLQTATKEELAGFFDEIYESGSRLMSLLNDLLDLSKLESGKTDYDMRESDFIDIAETVRNEMSAFAEERKLKLVTSYGTEQAMAVFDSQRIMQVLRNIISNAIKFSNPETEIRISVETKKLALRCSITNHGVGIPAEELETIFDKFIQSTKTKTGAGGTGLGLAICREIIKQHHGKVWAESQVNGETSFIFEIPQAIKEGSF